MSEVNPKLIKSIEELKTSINEISVYDLNCYSAIELYYRIATKLNEVIDEMIRYEIVVSDQIIEQNKALQNLLDKGVKDEVVDKINEMVNNGTMDTIINTIVFSKIDKKLKVSVTDFGAIGDGIADDTEAIQNAIDFVSGYHWAGTLDETFKTITGGTVIIPEGKYRITSTIFVPPYVTIEGNNASWGINHNLQDLDLTTFGTVIITDINDTTSFAFDTAPFDENGRRLTGSAKCLKGTETLATQRQEGITIKNLMIYNDFKNKILFGGISLKSSPYANIIDVGIIGADVCIYINASWCCNIVRCGLFGLNYGIYGVQDVNRVTVDSCDITQAFGHTVEGTPLRRYTNGQFDGLYMAEGDVMPDSYVSLSTGIYLQATLQMEVRSCSIECWERGIFASYSAVTVEDSWFESIQIVDIQRVQGSVISRHNRKETYYSKHIRSGGDDGILLIDGLSGNNKSGASISDFDSQLVDNISNQSKVIMNNCNNCTSDIQGLTPFKSAGLSTYKSNAQIRQIEFLTGRINITEGTNFEITLPEGFDRWNCYTLGLWLQQPNANMILAKDIWLTDTVLIVKAPITQENTFYQTILIKAY